MRMIGDFKFHPVGHGLFYSGVITASEFQEPWIFVYDCGGSGAKNKFIRFWNPIREIHPNIRLSLLVISHFHQDHISGIPELIRTAKPKSIVLPYLYPEEKITYIAALLSNSHSRANSDATKDMAALILNPVSFCRSLCEDTRVYYVSHAEALERGYGDVNDNDERALENLQFPNEELEESSDGVSVVRNGAIGKLAGWAFHFFMSKKSTNYGEIKEWMIENRIDEAWLSNATIDEPIFEDIWRRFRNLGLNNNGSNLVCVHGPTWNVLDTHRRCACGLGCGRVCFPIFLNTRQDGCNAKYVMLSCFSGKQMLTGDAEFDGVPDFSNWMSCDEFNRISLFQVPHHGSPKNWRKWFECQLPSCVVWVVPHAFSSKRDQKNLVVIHRAFGNSVYYVKQRLNVGLTSPARNCGECIRCF